MSMEGPRLLDKLMGGGSFTTDPEGVVTIVEGPWEALDTKKVVQRTFFDLAGYNRPALTTFFQGIDFQYGGPPKTDDVSIQIYDMVTTEYLSDAELIQSIGGNIRSGPGFSDSTLNMEQVIYARARQYTSVLNAPDPLAIPLTHVDTWGTCSASNADRLHVTRVFVFGSYPTLAQIPNCNVVITAIIGKEKELPYMMRLKRSYELAQRN